MKIPPLTISCPPCEHCGEETTFEDGYLCWDCGIWWPTDDDAPGIFLDETTPRCNRHTLHKINGNVQLFRSGLVIQYSLMPCVLPLGHATSEHWHLQSSCETRPSRGSTP